RGAAVARGAGGVEKSAAAGAEADPCSVRGDGRRARHPDRQARDSAPPHRRDEGDMGAAAAFRAEERPASLRPPRARKIPGRIRLPRAEERERRGAPGTLAMVGKVSARRRGRAPSDVHGAAAGGAAAAPAPPPQERVAAAWPGAGLKRAQSGLRGIPDDTRRPAVYSLGGGW